VARRAPASLSFFQIAFFAIVNAVRDSEHVFTCATDVVATGTGAKEVQPIQYLEMVKVMIRGRRMPDMQGGQGCISYSSKHVDLL
jgi:hypothetical protein